VYMENMIGSKRWLRAIHLGIAIVLAAGALTLLMAALSGQQANAQEAAGSVKDRLENLYPTVAMARSNQLAPDESLAAQEMSSTLEIFSWWTLPTDSDALNALVGLYQTDHPTVTVIISSDYSVLNDRLLGGTPPDSFQTHIGMEMIERWTKPGYLDPITQLWQDEGWLDKFPSKMVELASYRGQIYAVPLNVHRGNVLWCNKSIFLTQGLTVPLTFQEFFTVADQLQAAGITPLALGDKNQWPATHLFEDVLLGTLGPEGYGDLWTGKLAFTDIRVKQALETFEQMLAYVNADHAALTWDQAAQLLVDDQAAMMVMGDWANGYFRANGWQPDTDYCWGPSPNTSDSLMLISDAFVLPAGAPNRDNGLAWLRLLGSVDGQDVFNPLKGSAPARLDADPNLYDVYTRWSMARIMIETHTPSMVHRLAAPMSFVEEAGNIIANFIASQDVDAAAEALQQAAFNAGFWPPPVYLPIILKLYVTP
jgi:glucose/mannose transport system substrate-binding protein